MGARDRCLLSISLGSVVARVETGTLGRVPGAVTLWDPQLDHPRVCADGDFKKKQQDSH